MVMTDWAVLRENRRCGRVDFGQMDVLSYPLVNDVKQLRSIGEVVCRSHDLVERAL
jgi:hypothetical protein